MGSLSHLTGTDHRALSFSAWLALHAQLCPRCSRHWTLYSAHGAHGPGHGAMVRPPAFARPLRFFLSSFPYVLPLLTTAFPTHPSHPLLPLYRVVVFVAEILAFSVAFQLLYEFPRINIEGSAVEELDYVPRALFTLLKWTLGEVGRRSTPRAQKPQATGCWRFSHLLSLFLLCLPFCFAKS